MIQKDSRTKHTPKEGYVQGEDSQERAKWRGLSLTAVILDF